MKSANPRPQLYLALTPGKRLLLLVCLFLVGMFLIGLLSGVVGIDTTKKIRIVTVMQDLIMFIMPAMVTALLVTRQPAQLLDLDVRPRLSFLFVAIAAMVAAIPAMEWIITLNQNLPLPDAAERLFRGMEDSAADTIRLACGEHTPMNLVVNIMIIGVLAGVSEELLFRGCLQRLLYTSGMNIHAAIWISAAVFSLMHMQIYGFVPRLLLGAFFGYSLYWSSSLWVPMLLHIINNTIYLVTQYNYGDGQPTSAVLPVVISVVLTAAIIWWMRSQRLKPEVRGHES